MSATTLSEMAHAYLVCALWSSFDESDESGGEPFDANYSIDDIAPEAIAQAVADCDAFERDNAADLGAWREAFGSDEQAGHDFWLTRNRHGAGFWDRFSSGHELHATGQRLTDAAHAYGECDLYLSDDGRIYCT